MEHAKIQEPEPGCWINAIAPTEEERNYLIEQIGVYLNLSNLHWMKKKVRIWTMTMILDSC